ncbi:MAG: manganese catalase family protein [Bacillota bacterium]|nr:manganese catalase family protein [Bacillota bacterium]
MWIYEKKLQYPVNVTATNPRMAQMLFTAYGGPDGELSAALRYLNQRYTMPTMNTRALLTDIGTEEMAHLEIIATLISKLTEDADLAELAAGGMEGNFIEHGKALFYVSATDNPFTATYFNAKDDPIADLVEDMAAEQKARVSYNHLLDVTDDPGVIDVLRFLREREIVHFQRFGEAKRTRCNNKPHHLPEHNPVSYFHILYASYEGNHKNTIINKPK